MDPFSSDGELVNIHGAFVQGQYNSVINDYTISDFSQPNHLPARILQYRAQLELGQHDEVLQAVSTSDAQSTPDLAAVRIYASYLKSPSDSIVDQAEKLAEQHGNDNLTVQLLCAAVLARGDRQEQALHLLSKHQGSLDAVALAVQIHLLQNRTDLAVKEAKSARSFAQDALLVNLAESWIGMRQGGEHYQKAFYVFEELAQAPSSQSATSLIAQAVSEMHMGRVEEAETALNTALELEPQNATGLANKFVLDTVAGKDASEARAKLESVDKEHEVLKDMLAKREQFQAAMAKFNPKFEP
ncbi:Coatomer subunit epsilon-1 [Teratosphaeria destructans]|uniref:Coatomer subunit epsilon n=1 Tax=Teratosphaeria destructans TaxID=418781 RepID=A0A9W7SPK4_9PEZI|nr:Coatomer subunit epsilon-1 [Teratosphaeria destructans]